MHVGVCMRVSADSLEEAKTGAQQILYKYSHEEATRDIDIRLSLQDFLKSWKRDEDIEMDDEAIKLLLETESKEEIYYDLLEDDFLDRNYYDLDFHELEENMTPLIGKILEVFEDCTDEELDSAIIFDNNCRAGEEIFIDGDEVVICFGVQFNYGYWDYDYGTTESFGLGEDEDGAYRIWSGAGKNINRKFLDKLFNDDLKALNVVEFWVNEDEEVSPGGDLEFVKKMFSNIDEDTYFITGSVHV